MSTEGLKGRVKAARSNGAGEPQPVVEGTIDQHDAVAVSPYKTSVALLGQKAELLGRAAPEGGPTGMQLVTDAVTALGTVKKLDLADPATVLGAVLTCAQLGLRVGGALGQAYVLPFWNTDRRMFEATFVLGYKGITLLAAQSGYVRGIAARTVFAKDSFDIVWREDRDELVHKPYLLDDPGEPNLYYARALLSEGGYQLTRPVTRDSMRAHRSRYVKVKSGPWFDDRGKPGDGFEAMCHKTTIKVLGRTLPLSTTARRAIAADGGVRRSEALDAEFDEMTEHHGEAEGTPGTVDSAGAERAYDTEWPDGATATRPAEKP
jgi:recombination protein RecT